MESQEQTLPSVPFGDDEDRDAADLQLTRIGHYVLLHQLGEGGMGVVYAAYDETLDRKVALKLLRTAGGGSGRLLREAQALARVSHPNVVQVYEVGECEHGTFIAMEFVDGLTLRAWLGEQRREQAQILEVFATAGRGLIAAHQKGLIHRDFKPDNVMVSRDGRVLVMDFGLARVRALVERSRELALDSEREHQLLDDHATQATSDLTMTGAMMGTPAYMAPEQYAGANISPATDQFGFCVALWEALSGQRPFAGSNLAALHDAITSQRICTSEARELPTWLRRVLERGLSPDPEQRWASMSELLAALDDDPTRRRRWWTWAVAATLLVFGGGTWTHLTLARRQDERRAAHEAAVRVECDTQARAITRAWTPDVHAQLAQTFAATKTGRSGEAWTRTAARLDAYTEDWSRVRAQVCLASELEHSIELAAAAEVAVCLDEAQAVFAALLDAWQQLDDEMVTRAPAAAAELPLPTMCTNPAWLALQVPPPDDEATRGKVLELRARLEHVAALQLAATLDDAAALSTAVLQEAETLGWAPLEVEARFVHGDLLELRGDPEAAREQLRRAFFDAARVGHDLIALQAASKLTWTVGMDLSDHQQALLWGELGQLFVVRMGLEGTIHEAKLLNAIASLQYRMGDNEAALRNYQRALEIREHELGATHPQVAATLNNIGLIESSLGHYETALAALRRALDIRRQALGSKHPSVAASLSNIGLTYKEQGDFEAALAASLEALPLIEASLGPEHPQVATALNNLGVIQTESGDYQGAIDSLRRGLELKRAVFGPEHATIALSLANLGEAQRKLGDLDGARATLEQAYAIRDQAARMPIHRAEHAFSLAQLLAVQGERARALELAELAIEEYRASGEGQAKYITEVEAWRAQLLAR